mmetsp:Transcript_132651/g.424472  ORF Transcript_132651/g.424472 Transcript_132651/m.424472 type:complete len:204 (+) Transcript_132651:206-817(+)
MQVLKLGSFPCPRSLHPSVTSKDLLVEVIPWVRSCKCRMVPGARAEATATPLTTWLICRMELGVSRKVRVTRCCMPAHRVVVQCQEARSAMMAGTIRMGSPREWLCQPLGLSTTKQTHWYCRPRQSLGSCWKKARHRILSSELVRATPSSSMIWLASVRVTETSSTLASWLPPSFNCCSRCKTRAPPGARAAVKLFIFYPTVH